MRVTRALIVGVVVTVLAVGCSDDEPSTSSDTTATASQDLVAEATLPPSPTTSIVPPDVAVATSSLGSILVDGEGMTLYVFSNDAPGSSSCIDACAISWPPLAASSVAVGDDLDPADFSLITRPDGTSQLAVGQRPLYRFAGDIAPGETSGQGLNGVWYVVSPDGTPIESS